MQVHCVANNDLAKWGLSEAGAIAGDKNPKAMAHGPNFEQDYDKYGPVYTHCRCAAADDPAPGEGSQFHIEHQDVTGEAWRQLQQLIDTTAREGLETFAPRHHLAPDLWAQISMLPPEISKLTQVRFLNLYGSNLIAIPPQIGDMANLESFDVYTSRRLHWLPYEITRCANLRHSRVSTRHQYGNWKTDPPFPKLPADLPDELTPACCSVCQCNFSSQPIQRWISLRVATDTMALLVHACSEKCVQALPPEEPIRVEHARGGGRRPPR